MGGFVTKIEYISYSLEYIFSTPASGSDPANREVKILLNSDTLRKTTSQGRFYHHQAATEGLLPDGILKTIRDATGWI